MSRPTSDISTPAQSEALTLKATYGLCNYGFRHLRQAYWNLPPEALYQEIDFRSEGSIIDNGPVIVETGQHTDLAANDRFVVSEGDSEDEVWWGKYNRPFRLLKFNAISQRMLAYIQGRDLFVCDCYAGADPNYRLPVRVITEHAWQSLLAQNMFIRPEANDELRTFVPGFTVISMPSFRAMPEIDRTDSDTFILVNLDQRLCIIGGTAYGGEIKKAVFTALNYLLPSERVLSMRCSANIGQNGNPALFFGLSGTGKTSLAISPDRRLVGDDEHGWSDEGIFSIENGCYARVLNLSPTDEPEIHECIGKRGTVLENVVCDSATGGFLLDDASLTVNTRASFPLRHLINSVPEQTSGHPKNIVMLTCDATGVLPPVVRLTPEQATYHFISGYSCHVTGDDVAPDRQPEQIFSPGFGAQFMVHHPSRYYEMFRDKVIRYGVQCWLVNTGWTGGPYGIGKRMNLEHTRILLKAALSGELDQVEYSVDPVFGFEVPRHCDGVPDQILVPRETWENPQAYDEKHLQLASLFLENFKKFQDGCLIEITKAGPDLSKQ